MEQNKYYVVFCNGKIQSRFVGLCLSREIAGIVVRDMNKMAEDDFYYCDEVAPLDPMIKKTLELSHKLDK